MSDTVDIGVQVQELANKLGFPDKGVISAIVIEPSQATVEWYALDADGKKHVLPNGTVSMHKETFKVLT